jgi:hypothetical protein
VEKSENKQRPSYAQFGCVSCYQNQLQARPSGLVSSIRCTHAAVCLSLSPIRGSASLASEADGA